MSGTGSLNNGEDLLVQVLSRVPSPNLANAGEAVDCDLRKRD